MKFLREWKFVFRVVSSRLLSRPFPLPFFFFSFGKWKLKLFDPRMWRNGDLGELPLRWVSFEDFNIHEVLLVRLVAGKRTPFESRVALFRT